MTEELFEIEGTWEEILAHADLLAGRRLHVTAYPRVEGASVGEGMASFAARVPPEEWSRLPGDLSDRLDHYVYGPGDVPEVP